MLLAVSEFSLQQQTGKYVITIPLKGLALFSTLYPGGTDEYSYAHYLNSQDFALSGGVSFKGRILEFRMYHNFANLFSKVLKSTYYKEISQ